jgi:hypothetical protein
VLKFLSPEWLAAGNAIPVVLHPELHACCVARARIQINQRSQ